MMLITPEYREQNAALHEASAQYGARGDKGAEIVGRLRDRYSCKTVLDYGCGKAGLAKACSFPVACYDPSVPMYNARPMSADLVVCRDVLEHVEEGCLDDVLRDLHSLTDVVMWVLVVLEPSEEILPDGRNTHITLRSREWWTARIGRLFARRDLGGRDRELSMECWPLIMAVG